ncbi:hypothetical protein LTR36_007741 [Oleoguttula mirabilis]|uniref:Ubiquitination network signaling protein n=1 Tax=Oleoguttula mirabilis TaxID=1507867 RepID=A0AAV9JUH0_9PEZI|nr:hypothetical protein LTR36_007741 [Oleoguttula mirabilis]
MGSTKNDAPNKRDTRHERGLATPTTKKYSNGQLNAPPNGKPVASLPPPALPTTGLNQGFRFPRAPETTTSPAETAAPAETQDYVAVPEGKGRDRTASEISLEELGPCADMADNANEPASSAAPSVDAQAAPNKPSSPHAAGTVSAVSTILAYYPLRDAISILILLLSLPPTLVLVIQTLFASLTFVPPTAGISMSTLPNIREMFNASNLGYPALATILIVDLIFFVCWLPVWKPAQNLLLDLSQAVVAVSLSGAAASTGGPTYSIATCTLIVCMVHVLRFKAIHLTALDYLRSVINKTGIGIPLDVPTFASTFLSPPPMDHGWIFTVIRTMLGIHIVSQGVTTCIRRSLVKANERDQLVPAITKTDPEAAIGSEPSSRLPTGLSDGPQQSYTASSTDGRPPGPSPSQRDGKARESSSKKKKKQANQVRSQQPFWAAIASTKVTFVKEMEQRDAADDAREASAMDTNTKPTYTSTMNPATDRIWILEVRDTEIFFSVDLSPDSAAQSVEHMQEGMSVSAGIDKSKPFYVRVNGAAWSSTRIMSSATGDAADGKPRFDGEIFGLAPRSSYNCEIVGIATGNVLCSVSLITQAAPSAEQTSTAPSQPTHPALRPSSPITTLKQSIQSAEAKLNETRNRTRKSKKDQRGVHSDIRKEINMLRSKLESSGGLDDKQERRLMQINQHKNQAEEATVELKGQIEAFGDIPNKELEQSEIKQRSWQAARDVKRAADKENYNARNEADRDLSALKTEIAATESKREKLLVRHAQRSKELEMLLSKQHADMSAKEKRDFERTQLVQSRHDEEAQLRYHIANMEAEANSYQTKAHEAYQQLGALQSWNTVPPAYNGYSSPPTPEGTLPGTNGSLSPQTNGFSTFGSQPFQSPFHSAQPSMSTPHVPRGRSSSMLSQYSGFTDNGDDYIFPSPQHQQTWPMQSSATAGAAMTGYRKESESGGSGSLTTNGSTGSNSPRPDAKPFVPSNGRIGPIGPPSKSRDKVPQSPGTIGSGR